MTIDAQLRRSNSIRTSGNLLTHRALKPGYQPPRIPEGYTHPVVKIGRSGNALPDYGLFSIPFDPTKFKLASLDDANNTIIQVEWPWKDGFIPHKEDWESIGFMAEIVFDNCFGGGCAESSRQCWLNR